MTVEVRDITADDEPFLWQMLFYAAHMYEEEGKAVADAQQDPALALYVTHWGRVGDIGLIAVENATANPLGAAWARLYPDDQKAYSNTDDNTPEIAMAVLPEITGQGIGTVLLTGLIARARLHHAALALNVRADNPALHLYQRCGFEIISKMTNRVGGLSYDMRLML